jgi:FkbM family methyltransferase
MDYLRWRIGCILLSGRPVKKNILGKPMLLEPRLGGIHQELFLYGRRETECTAFLPNWIPAGAIVADVGANIGYYALIESDRAAKVYAIEPSPQNLNLLKDNLALNNCTDRVEVHQIAISNNSGKALFTTSEVPNHHRLLGHSEKTPKNVIEVKATTLDEFIGDRDVDVIRMDIQGAEWLVLQGMKKILERKKPLRLFIEVHNRRIGNYGGDARTMYDFLFGQGFRIRAIVLFGYRQGYTRAFPEWLWASCCPHQYVANINLGAADQASDRKLREFIENEDTYNVFMER